MPRLLRLALRATWGVVAVGVFVGGAVAVAALFLWMAVEKDFRESEVAVPDVQGLSAEEAARVLSRSDLTLSIEARRPHDGVPAGHVFFQDPLAGSVTRRKRQVKVVLSTGVGRVQVPDLIGQSARKSVITLGQAGLVLGDIAQVHSSRHATGQVIAQQPEPGAPSGESGRVDLLQSLGRRPRAYVMPDLRGHPLSRVEMALASAGLRLGEVKQEVLPDVPRGTVASQYPPPGSRVSSESVVSVVVASDLDAPVRDMPVRPRLHLE